MVEIFPRVVRDLLDWQCLRNECIKTFYRHDGPGRTVWILTFVMIVLGTFIIGPAVTGNVHPDLEWYTTNLSEYTRNMSVTAWWGGSQIIILLIVLYLSVFKPTKKKNNARV